MLRSFGSFIPERTVYSLKKKISAGIILAGLTAAGIFIFNRIIYYFATIDKLLNYEDGNYFEWRFGKIFYKKMGEGKPILLIHDLNSHSSGYEWKKAAPLLAKTNTVYVIDLPGCGRSEKPNLTYTNFFFAQMITDFIKGVIGEKTDVIATGESASFVITACHMGDDIIGKVAMVNPASLKELAKVPTKRTKTLKLLIQTPLIGSLLYNILQSRKYIEEAFVTKYYYNPVKTDEHIADIYYESAHLDHSHSRFLFGSIKGRYTKMNILHCLKNTNNSIFIISGKEMPEYENIQEEYRHYIPAVEPVSLEDTAYLPQLERPEVFCEQIQIFFEDEQ